ncbi:MAG: hypothetical protein U1F56_02345 [Rubrivivax sp.]
MNRWILCLLALLLAGCAAVERAPPPGPEIFRDDLFAPAPPPDLDALFALTPEMRSYLQERIVPLVRRKGSPQHALLDALYTQGELRLEYDATHTRTVGEAFAARRGNCLSLVVMTAAFAQELGLQLRYQEVLGAPAVEQDGDLTFLVGHVNLAMGSGMWSVRQVENGSHWLVVDFLPGQDLQRQRTQPLEERRIRAMFMNNRAAEEMARGHLDQAYGWLRAGHAQDATLANLYNTLGVLYRRRGAVAEAERALRVALAMDPTHDPAAGNLAAVLREGGRAADAERLARGRAAPQPGARFSQARQALADGQLKQALRLLHGELGLTPRNPELHYWLAMTWAQAGDGARSRQHLELAAEYSASGEQKALYAGKLARLKAQAEAGP